MAVFVVSYDLRKAGRNYQGLYDRLGAWKAIRGLQSVWFINWQTTAETIRNDLFKQLDANDGLFVGRLSGEAAWNGLESTTNATLKKWLEGGS